MSYAFCALASQHSHIIPVEGYETELQVLGQHVEIPETPIKVVKITKTVAVKIPVPYPVKVREKVPYPVHVAKPYPVPVPQIIQVPHVVQPKAHREQGGGGGAFQNTHQRVGNQGYPSNRYDLPVSLHGDSTGPEHGAYNDGSFGNNHNVESISGDYTLEGGQEPYKAPSASYYENTDTSDDSNSFETRSYDQAINNYLQKNKLNGNDVINGYNH